MPMTYCRWETEYQAEDLLRGVAPVLNACGADRG